MDEKHDKEFEDSVNIDALLVMDNISQAVEMWSGVKNQFINAGWSMELAEKMTYEFVKMGTASAISAVAIAEMEKRKELGL